MRCMCCASRKVFPKFSFFIRLGIKREGRWWQQAFLVLEEMCCHHLIFPFIYSGYTRKGGSTFVKLWRGNCFLNLCLVRIRIKTLTVCHIKSRLLSDKPHSSDKVGNGHPLGFRMPVAIVLGLPDGLKEFPVLLRTGFC